MKEKNNGGFSLLETVVAMAILAVIVIPVCSSLVLSVRLNEKAGNVLDARLAVSSTVEKLMAQGITEASEDYGGDDFPGVTVKTTQAEDALYYDVEVAADNGLFSVTTCIRAVETPEEDANEEA